MLSMFGAATAPPKGGLPPRTSGESRRDATPARVTTIAINATTANATPARDHVVKSRVTGGASFEAAAPHSAQKRAPADIGFPQRAQRPDVSVVPHSEQYFPLCIEPHFGHARGGVSVGGIWKNSTIGAWERNIGAYGTGADAIAEYV